MAGYLCSTIVLQKILNQYGWRGLVLIVTFSKLTASLTLSAGPPFPIIFPAYFILGFGVGLSDSGFCAWGSSVSYANVVQGCMHGSFSIGAVLGPIFALSIMQRDLGWYSFYRLWVSGSLHARSYEN